MNVQGGLQSSHASPPSPPSVHSQWDLSCNKGHIGVATASRRGYSCNGMSFAGRFVFFRRALYQRFHCREVPLLEGILHDTLTHLFKLLMDYNTTLIPAVQYHYHLNSPCTILSQYNRDKDLLSGWACTNNGALSFMHRPRQMAPSA